MTSRTSCIAECFGPEHDGSVPKFPAFAPVTGVQHRVIAAYTEQFPPYSDFAPASLKAWDVKGQMGVAALNGNLVVRFHNAQSGRCFYSFLGRTSTEATALTLLRSSRLEGLRAELRLVPEEAAMSIRSARLEIIEDRDHADYLIDIDAVLACPGRRNQERRRLVRKLRAGNELSSGPLDLTTAKPAVMELCRRWTRDKIGEGKDVAQAGLYGAGASAEMLAVSRLIDQARSVPHLSVGLWRCGELIGFSIGEVVHRGTALLHFLKSDCRRHKGAHDAVLQAAAEAAADAGCRVINYQEDLGLPSLRAAKMRVGPTGFLRKFSIREAR